MLGTYYKIQLSNNEDLSFFGIYTEDDEDGNPINLSAYNAYMSIVDSSGTEVLDCSSYTTISGENLNILTVLVPAEFVAEISPDTYYYDLVITNNTITTRLLYGEIVISAGYTVIPEVV